MIDWRAYGLERCEGCGELFTWNDYYFPGVREGVCMCRGCLGRAF